MTMIKVTRPLHFTRLSDNTFSFYVVNIKRHLKGKKATKKLSHLKCNKIRIKTE